MIVITHAKNVKNKVDESTEVGIHLSNSVIRTHFARYCLDLTKIL